MNIIIKVLLILFFLEPFFAFSFTTKYSTIKVNGNVIARPCTVIPDEKIVDLGDIFTYAMTPYSPWVDFQIRLTGCPEGTNDVSALFTGEYDTVNNYYKNKGTAKNIGIQLKFNDNNDLIKSGDSKVVGVDDNENATFYLSARAYKNSVSSTGTLQSNINIIYTWL